MGAETKDPPANVERAGGTRFSAGKAVQTWFPWRGMGRVWEWYQHVRNMDNGNLLVTAERAWRQALNDPVSHLDDIGFAACCAAEILHREEAKRLIQEGHDIARDGWRAPFPALGTEVACHVSVMGAEKYAEFDWNEGQSYSVLMSSGHRHLKKAIAFGPTSRDHESDLPHLGHFLWNAACLLDLHEQGRSPELDDVGPKRGKTTADKRRMIEEGTWT